MHLEFELVIACRDRPEPKKMRTFGKVCKTTATTIIVANLGNGVLAIKSIQHGLMRCLLFGRFGCSRADDSFEAYLVADFFVLLKRHSEGAMIRMN